MGRRWLRSCPTQSWCNGVEVNHQALLTVPATALTRARRLSHNVVQWASRAARANLEAQADDSHSNLGWREENHALVSHPLDAAHNFQLGFSFSSSALVWLVDGKLAESMPLKGADFAAASGWCDSHLTAVGLRTMAHADMPYELEPVDYGEFSVPDVAAELEALGAWYSVAQAGLQDLVVKYRSIAVLAPSVRCWPHHFDLATLFVLDSGDPETARSVGAGLSPGDQSYAEPYFYCTPWPTPDRLPEAPAQTHWHTEGFVSLVCPVSRIDRVTKIGAVLTAAVKVAYESL